MSDSPSPPTFTRTLPLFTSEDRDVLQRLLHHAVEDFAYDHPDRKIARDLYHKIREGEAFRMRLGESLDDSVLLVDPQLADVSTGRIVERFVAEMHSHDGEWQDVADELEHWWSNNEAIQYESVIGFEYNH